MRWKRKELTALVKTDTLIIRKYELHNPNTSYLEIPSHEDFLEWLETDNVKV